MNCKETIKDLYKGNCGECKYCKPVPIGDFRCALDTTKRVWPMSTKACKKIKK